MCVKKDFIIEECLEGTTWNKSVFLVTIEGRNVVLKVDKLWFENMNGATRFLQNQTNVFDDYFQQIVDKYLGNNCNNFEILVSKLLSMADTNGDGLVTLDEAAMFGSILLNREIFMLAAMNGSNSAITFYGYCGGIYIVERVSTAKSNFIDTSIFPELLLLPDFLGDVETYLQKLMSHPVVLSFYESVYIFYKKLRKESGLTLEQRVDFVIGMVELMYDLASFDYGEIFSCDLNLDNFGFSDLSNFSTVKQTDFDEVFAAAKVIHKAKEKPCTTDGDCVGVYEDNIHHTECSSFCKDNGFCSKKMKKDNLAFLCETIFFHVFFNPVTSALSDKKSLTKTTVNYILKILRECERPVLYSSVDEHLISIRKVSNRFRKVRQLIKTHS